MNPTVPSLPVSVVMATYNGERYLPVQLASVLGQLRGDDELVIVDDGSSDGTLALIEALGSPHVRLHRNPRNLGVRRTFERALALARHEVVFFCDQDDEWVAGKRDAFVAAFAADPGCMVVISDAAIVDGEGRQTAPSFMAGRGGFRGDVLGTVIRNRYLGCAMAVRRPVVDVALPMPDDIPMHDMWFGAIGSLLGRVRHLPEPWLNYRRHGRNASPSSRAPWQQVLRWRVALVRALLGRLPRIRRAGAAAR